MLPGNAFNLRLVFLQRISTFFYVDFAIDESLYTNNICGIFQGLSRLKSSSQEMPGKSPILLIYAKNPGFVYAVFICPQALDLGL